VLDTENLPLRAADQAALLLDWGFTVPPGTDGVGRLAEPADLVAAPEPSRAAPRVAAPAGAVTADPAGDAASPLVGAGLAVAAVAVVVVTVIGRRRAVRRVPSSGEGR
jgi:D-alanyl-D-alanine carboxypeptidase (penicillin-binding protein 5/6)